MLDWAKFCSKQDGRSEVQGAHSKDPIKLKLGNYVKMRTCV